MAAPPASMIGTLVPGHEQGMVRLLLMLEAAVLMVSSLLVVVLRC